MKVLYLMRHGQTYFNQINKTQGWCDSPLTDQGINEAKKAKQYFIDHGIHFDYAMSSSLGRASDTLDIIADNFIEQTERSKDLREFSFGRYEGESAEILPSPPYGDYFVPFGGESDSAAVDRFNHKLINSLAHDEIQQVLVVSHGSIICEFSRYWANNADIENEVVCENGSILVYRYEDDIFCLVDRVSFSK